MDLRRGLVARKPCTGSTETKRIHSRAQQGQRQPEATWDKRGHSFPWLCVCWPQEVCWTCRQDLSTLRSTWEVSTWGYRFFLLEQGFWASLRMDTYIPTFPKYRCLRGHRLIFGSHLVSILCGNEWKWILTICYSLFPWLQLLKFLKYRIYNSQVVLKLKYCFASIHHQWDKSNLFLHGLLQVTFPVSRWTV